MQQRAALASVAGEATAPLGQTPATARALRRRRALATTLLAALTALIALAATHAAVPTLRTPAPPSAPPAGVASSSPATWAQLSPLARLAISRGIGADEPAYWPTRAGSGLQALNATQHLSLRFAPGGVTVTGALGSLGLSLRSARADGRPLAASAAAPTARANRVSYDRGAITEWYANGPSGLEQGFSVARAAAPAARRSLALTLALHAGSGLHTRLSAGGVDVLAGHRLALRYSGLQVVDATGRSLRAWMTLHGSQRHAARADRRRTLPAADRPDRAAGPAAGRRRHRWRQPRTGDRRLGLADRRRGAERNRRWPVPGGRRVPLQPARRRLGQRHQRRQVHGLHPAAERRAGQLGGHLGQHGDRRRARRAHGLELRQHGRRVPLQQAGGRLGERDRERPARRSGRHRAGRVRLLGGRLRRDARRRRTPVGRLLRRGVRLQRAGRRLGKRESQRHAHLVHQRNQRPRLVGGDLRHHDRGRRADLADRQRSGGRVQRAGGRLGQRDADRAAEPALVVKPGRQQPELPRAVGLGLGRHGRRGRHRRQQPGRRRVRLSAPGVRWLGRVELQRGADGDAHRLQRRGQRRARLLRGHLRHDDHRRRAERPDRLQQPAGRGLRVRRIGRELDPERDPQRQRRQRQRELWHERGGLGHRAGRRRQWRHGRRPGLTGRRVRVRWRDAGSVGRHDRRQHDGPRQRRRRRGGRRRRCRRHARLRDGHGDQGRPRPRDRVAHLRGDVRQVRRGRRPAHHPGEAGRQPPARHAGQGQDPLQARRDRLGPRDARRPGAHDADGQPHRRQDARCSDRTRRWPPAWK